MYRRYSLLGVAGISGGGGDMSYRAKALLQLIGTSGLWQIGKVSDYTSETQV